MAVFRRAIEERAERLRGLASAIQSLELRNPKMQGIVGFLVGALYSLWQANGYEYADKSGQDVTPAKLLRVAREISDRKTCAPFVAGETDWFTSLQFNNAVLRLDSIRLRLEKEKGIRLGSRTLAALERLREDANNLKHKAGGSVQHKRQASFEDALNVAGDLITTLETTPA